MINQYDVREFLDLLKKADKEQLRAMHKSIVTELENRDKRE